MSVSEKQQIYRVSFYNDDRVYQIFVEQIYESSMYGFIEVEKILFGEQSAVVIDPSEEKLRHEFEGVEKAFLPSHSIIRIDVVKKRGSATIKRAKNDTIVRPFPLKSVNLKKE